MQAQMQEKELILDIETEMRVGTSKGTNEPLVPADEMNSVLLNKVILHFPESMEEETKEDRKKKVR